MFRVHTKVGFPSSSLLQKIGSPCTNVINPVSLVLEVDLLTRRYTKDLVLLMPSGEERTADCQVLKLDYALRIWQ